MGGFENWHSGYEFYVFWMAIGAYKQYIEPKVLKYLGRDTYFPKREK